MNYLPSLELTAKAPENGWLEEDPFPFGARSIFRGELLVARRVSKNSQPTGPALPFWGVDLFGVRFVTADSQ